MYPMEMNLYDVYRILDIQQPTNAEEVISRYRELKERYNQIKETTKDLKTQMLYQRKLIELDDAYLYFIRHHM
jgi:preprotein translocase subunit Sec63